MDLMSTMEVIFKSQASFNASFLVNGNLSCTSKSPGIDVVEAEKAFAYIAKFENETLKQIVSCFQFIFGLSYVFSSLILLSSQIWDGVTTDLLHSLKSSPADIETLRIYLILPLYHEFVNSKHYKTLHSPFCKAILQLTKNPQTIVLRWWCNQSSDYFERLVQIFKGVVSYIIDCKVKKFGSGTVMTYDLFLDLSLKIMKLLYNANHHSKNKVPYDVFTIPEINDNVDLRKDYCGWLNDKNVSVALINKALAGNFINNIFLFLSYSVKELFSMQLSVLIRCQS